MANVDRDMITRQIRDATDIVDLVSGYVTLKRAGSGFKGLCPFHQEKTPSFTVHPARQTFKCFGCDAGGDIFTFVQMKENVDFVEARRILADRAGIALEFERAGGSAQGPGKSDLARANDWARRVFRHYYESEAGRAARDYVQQRGISDEMAEAFGIGLAVDSYDALIRRAAEARVDSGLLIAAGLIKESQRGTYYDTFRNRLMFPIGDVQGRTIGFGGRTLGDDPAKYLNTPQTALFDKGRQLFGLDRAKQAISEKGRVIVVEGYTDCIMAHQYGFQETVATLGTAMTDDHATVLKRFTDRVILLFDSDTAGRRAADRALSVTLTVGLDVSLAHVPGEKDPCDYLLSAGEEAFEGVLNQAISALESKWRHMSGEYAGGTTGPARKRAVEAFLDELAGWAARGAIDPIQQGLMLNQLGKVLGMPAEDLHRRFGLLVRRSARVRSRGEGATTSDHDGVIRQKNAEQEAWRQIIEVLLNQPRFYEAVRDRFTPEAIRDPALSAVARGLAEAIKAEGGESFRLDALIGRFELPSFGRLITHLQARGEARGQYEETLARAWQCIESTRQARQAAELAARLRKLGDSNGDEMQDPAPAGDDARLAAFMNSARQSHFAPTRARRRFLGEAETELPG